MTDRFDGEPVFRDALFRAKRKHGKFVVVDAPQLDAPVFDSHTHVHLTADPALSIAKCMVWNVPLLCNVIDIAEDGEGAFAQLDAYLAEAPAIARDIAASAMVDAGALPSEPPDVRLIVGVHPHNAKHWDAAMEARLRNALRDPRVRAIGEAGLDFHYDFSPRDTQEAMFRAQIRMAHELGLPLCLHIREAHDLALAILREEGFPEAGCVLHCYTMGPDELEPWLAEGVYVGFDGPITFNSADEIREAARIVPLNRLLVETDAPYMTPHPMRGMECGPAHVIFVADALARVRGLEADDADGRREFFGQLVQNTIWLYGRGDCPQGDARVG